MPARVYEDRVLGDVRGFDEEWCGILRVVEQKVERSEITE